jgi:hypothetical protein
MTKLADLTVAGKSGNEYKFEVYARETAFNAVGAVYMVTKRTKKPGGNATHKFLYVGETGDLSTRFDDHHKQDCFDLEGANCICVHQDGGEKSRLAKESDLFKAHDWPCND